MRTPLLFFSSFEFFPLNFIQKVTKPERTMTTMHLIVVGFFWTSGGYVCRAFPFVRTPNAENDFSDPLHLVEIADTHTHSLSPCLRLVCGQSDESTHMYTQLHTHASLRLLGMHAGACTQARALRASPFKLF